MIGLEGVAGEVPVDSAGERRGRGCKISPHQARSMRQIRSTLASMGLTCEPRLVNVRGAVSRLALGRLSRDC